MFNEVVNLFHRHLDFFEMVRNEDERQLSKKFEVVSCKFSITRHIINLS